MTPSARAALAIALLDAALASSAPLDRTLDHAFRARRYMGSGDRRAVSAMVWSAVRHRARLAWHVQRHDALLTGRSWLLAAGALVAELADLAPDAWFESGMHGAPALTEDEHRLGDALRSATLADPAMPAWVALECPEDLWPLFDGDERDAVLTGMLDEAPVDLRVNTRLTARDVVLRDLTKAGVQATATPFSHVGVRLSGRVALGSLEVYRKGWIEPQDEASQIAAALVDARPGMRVLDLCAGAGGKTLALAAVMQGQGTLVAADTEAKRLERLMPRLRRAKAGRMVEAVVLDGAGWSSLQAMGSFDRVLIDAPCSGTGTWRRAPDARWRMPARRIKALQAVQRDLLRQALPLLASGGRLIYATCSVLPAENEAQIANMDLVPVPVREVWRKVLDGACPNGDPFLRLRPHSEGTDGFFTAILSAP